MIKLTLPGSIRSKKNSKQIIAVPAHRETHNKHFWAKLKWQYCYNQIQPSSAYKKWEEEARISVYENLDIDFNEPLEGPIHVRALIYYKGRRPDLSGAMESVGDCLEGIVWKDDSQIESWDGSRLIHDLKNPRTEVFIETFKEGEHD